MDHKDIRDTGIALVVLAAAVILGGRIGAWAASAVDNTQPVASAASASTPIRGNFATIKTEITALQAQHPASTDNALARYDGTDGTLQNGTCTETDQGNLSCAVNSSNSALYITQAGTGNIADLVTSGGLGLIIYDEGNIEHTANSTAAALDIQQQNATGNALSVATGAGASGDMTLALNETSGQCLTTVATNNDPTVCVKQGRVETTTNADTAIVTVPITDDKVYLIESRIVGRCTGGADCGSPAKGYAAVQRAAYKGVSGTPTSLATMASGTSVDFEQTDDTTWAVSHAVSGSNINVIVNGDLNTTVTWHATVTITSVGS